MSEEVKESAEKKRHYNAKYDALAAHYPALWFCFSLGFGIGFVFGLIMAIPFIPK